jgi:hypothetical protein
MGVMLPSLGQRFSTGAPMMFAYLFFYIFAAAYSTSE